MKKLLAFILMVLLLQTAGCSSSNPVSKETKSDGSISLGKLDSEGFNLLLNPEAYEGVANISMTLKSSDGAPQMPNATLMGQAYEVNSNGPQRLDEPGTLVYKYDPQKVKDPLLLALGYYDGQKWTYVQADSKDETAHTVTFTIWHFSTYYPSQFKSELEAAKHFTEQFAARKVLGEKGGDDKVASRAVSDLLANKLGLGESEFGKRMLNDIVKDQDVMKVVDECQADGWSNTAYEKVMSTVCDKLADHLAENRTGLTAEEGAVLTTGEKAFKEIGNLIKVADSGGKILGFLAGGDTKAAAVELLNAAADNTGALGKALKYTVQGMQNALNVWRDGEVEKAYQVYKDGSSGSLFGYGAIDPKDFDTVWDNMKGASRQLCIERIATENEARQMAGMPPLTPKEEDFYREKVKEELKNEFERRIELQGKIDAEKKNLDLIFEELDKGDMLDSSNSWYRGFGGPDETLEKRMARMEHLIQRIYTDLDLQEVYSGPQNTDELNGSISAAAMAEMIRGYFAADTQAEAEEFLKEYYKKFEHPLENEDLAGDYILTYVGGDWTPEANGQSYTIASSGQQYSFFISPAGSNSGTVTWDGSTFPYTFSGEEMKFQTGSENTTTTYILVFTKSGTAISATGTGYLQTSLGDAELPVRLDKLK